MQDVVKKDGDTITVEPILGLKVIKDLIVDMEPFLRPLSLGDAVLCQR